jgi:hypothetical protein
VVAVVVAVGWLDRSSRPWIPFHCDTAIVTCNVALSADLDDTAPIEDDATVSADVKHVVDHSVGRRSGGRDVRERLFAQICSLSTDFCSELCQIALSPLGRGFAAI